MRPNIHRSLSLAAMLALPLALAGCPCQGDDCGAETDVDTDADTTLRVHLRGNVNEVFTGVPAAVGQCVDVIDPREALQSEVPDVGALDVLATVEVGPPGTYVAQDVDVAGAEVGLFMNVRDCDASAGAVFPTATGLAAAAYAEASTGDLIHHSLVYLSAESAAGLDASLAALGQATLADGAMLALVLDSGGAPIGGATLSSSAWTSTTCYYIDADPSDGMLTTAGTPNAATQPGVGMALCVGPFVGAVDVVAAGHTFDTGLFGSVEGLVSVTAWFGR